MLFDLYDEDTRGTRPDRLVDVRPQERVQRRTVEQLVDAVSLVPLLDDPVPQTVDCPSCPSNSLVSPGRGRVIGNMLGWSQLEETDQSGVWLFRGAVQGENLFSFLDAAGGWEKKGSYRTAWSVPCGSSCTCSYAYGQGPAIGPPLMKPWCAEEEVPCCLESGVRPNSLF